MKNPNKTDHKEWHCICKCCSYEHQVHFDYWEDHTDEIPDRDMFMTIHLVDVPFWKRLKRGLAYIFGHKSRYGEFDEICLGYEHAKMFHEIADRLDMVDNVKDLIVKKVKENYPGYFVQIVSADGTGFLEIYDILDENVKIVRDDIWSIIQEYGKKDELTPSVFKHSDTEKFWPDRLKNKEE